MAKSIQKCEYCGFCTKNVYIFKRHKLRCRKDHGIGRGKKVPVEASNEVPLPGPSGDAEDTFDSGPENSMQETISVTAEEADQEDSSLSKKEKPAVNRNYVCSKCEFKTNKSRTFLYHMIENHKSKLDIYACSICEYCSRYRHKVQRHMKFAHKMIIQYDDVQTEYVSAEKAKASPVKPKPKRKPLMSKAMPGRKLMVKFMKKSSGETVNKLKAPLKNKQNPLRRPASSSNNKSTGQAVEETSGEDGKQIFKCKDCQFISDDKQKVAKHAVSWHVDTRSFKCNHCDYITFERSDFLTHRLLHKDDHKFKCEECTYTSDYKPNFDKHQLNHTANLQHKCRICSYSSATEAAIKRHMTLNHDSVPEDSNSGAPTLSKSKTPSVKASDTEDSNSIMNKTSGEVSPSDSPTSKNSPYDSTKASLLFNINFDASSASMVPRRTLPPPNLETMQFFMKELSPMRKLPPNISKYVVNESGKLVCPACKLKYKRSSDLNRHMKRKHGCKLREFLESDQALPPMSFTDDTDDSINDGFTDVGFKDDDVHVKTENEEDMELDDLTTKGEMNQENKTDEGDYEEIEYQDGDLEEEFMVFFANYDEDSKEPQPGSLNCKYCTFKAKWPSDLRRHMTVHSIEKRFKCCFCPKKYKYIGDMNVHIRKEHNKEPGDVKVVKVATIPRKKTSPALFKCPSCSYTSSWKSEIDRHARLHTGDKKFQCGQCTYQTYWRGDIRRHVYKHHPEIMTEGVALDHVINILKKSPEKLQLTKPKTSSVQQEGAEKVSSPAQMGIDNTSQSMQQSSIENQAQTMSMIPVEHMSQSVGEGNIDTDEVKASVKETPVVPGVYKCEYCDFMTNAPSKLKSHVATHTNIKRYMCPLCGKRANWKWDISKHIRRDHNDQVTQVVKLSRQDAEDTIQEYMETNPVVRREHHLNTPEKTMVMDASHHFYKCSLCDYSEERRISVSRHIRWKHENQDAQILMVKSSPHTQESPDRSMTEDKLLYSATPSPASSPSVVKYNKLAETAGGSEAGRPFMCSECGKKGATKGDIKKHYHYLHADKEIRIIYLGDGSQSVYSAKSEITQSKLAESGAQLIMENQLPENNDKSMLDHRPGKSPEQRILSTVQPKALGYIRPFQCSLCGRRSNWRWDILKHLRERHPLEKGEVITLKETEARATVQEYVHQQTPRANKLFSPAPGIRKGKSPSPLKEEMPEGSPQNYPMSSDLQLKETEAIDSEMKLMDIEVREQIHVNNMPTKGIFRQFKCSGCPYRSNWKTDVLRHFTRKHKDETPFVIMLKKDIAEATLGDYQYKRGHDCKGRSGLLVAASTQPKLDPRLMAGSPLPRKAWHGLEKKLWQCIICPYTGEDKVEALKHLGKHNMKAYRCTLCNWSANFRSGVYRHIQNKHPGDKTALCRLALKMIKEGPGNNEHGQAIIPGAVVPKMEPNTENVIRNESLASDPNAVNKARKVVYHCKLCTVFRSRWRSCVCRHLRQAHDNREYTVNCIKKIVKVPISQIEVAPMSDLASTVKTPAVMVKQSRPKNFECNVCPYRSAKGKMLRFHMRCHTPQPGVKQYKCKYCPYYVNRQRLLNQHIGLHLKGYKSQKEMNLQTSQLKSGHTNGSQSPATPKRHRCEKCPYTTNSKNDFLYHKQFHRPKPTADFKCDFCEYWVTHRRLLKQHMKVHGEAAEYMFNCAEQTPTKSEPENALVYDTVEIAEIKQRIIASKITPSISQSPAVSPMKIASSCTMGGKRGFLRKDGTYRKIHRCRNCPYMNIRLRNMRLHELMHGKRPASHPLIKCPHCDYHVGSKGLLAHHLKVHQPNYDIEMLGLDKDRRDSVASEDSELDTTAIPVETKVDSLLEIARYKKYGCEKCPYATSKKNRFQRHIELHGSKQKCKCDYCDYSVPSSALLQQHLKLHFEPNQNLLVAQSILNLQHLPEMPADVALASMMTNSDSKNPISITHDHIDLFENAPEDAEPKRLYRCDRCPYANIRRDNLLAHLRCHMTKNEFVCPYCDYSVGKTHVLVQHVKVHFSPLPELAEWLSENGDPQRMKEVKEKNITEALEVMKMLQNDKQKNNNKDGVRSVALVNEKKDGVNGETSGSDTVKKADDSMKQTDDKEKMECNMEVDNENPVQNSEKNAIKLEPENDMSVRSEMASGKFKQTVNGDDSRGNVPMETTNTGTWNQNAESIVNYVCQYCDRDFSSSNVLVQHEMQHLIGNSYEEMVSQLLEAANVLEKQETIQNDNGTVVLSDTSSDKAVTGDGSSGGVFIVNENGEKIGEMTPVKQRKEKTTNQTVVENTDKVVIKMEMD